MFNEGESSSRNIQEITDVTLDPLSETLHDLRENFPCPNQGATSRRIRRLNREAKVRVECLRMLTEQERELHVVRLQRERTFVEREMLLLEKEKIALEKEKNALSHENSVHECQMQREKIMLQKEKLLLEHLQCK